MSKNYLEMSDEEILNMESPVPEEENEPSDEEVLEESTPEEQEEETNTEEETVEDSEEEESKDDLNEDQEENNESTEEEKVEDKDTESEENTEEVNDYKSVYDRILGTPIKANGKDIKLNSVDEAVHLIQMGANYTKKMSALKPHLKILKTLENNKLLNENDITFLIDLKNKNPEAIAKFLSDAQIDPLDVDLKTAGNYQSKVVTASDEEIALSDVITELQDSDKFNDLHDVVINKWDNNSRRELYSNPNILRQLHDHMVEDSNGNSIFKYVSAEVERRKTLGLVQGMSDYQAYIAVGNDLYEQQKKGNVQSTTTQSKRVVKPAVKPSNVVDPETVKQNKKAASGVKPSKPSSKLAEDFNPLDLSDEEFLKIAKNNRY